MRHRARREPPERFPVSFYLVAMLFIMFDIEIIFLYPYAVVAAARSASYGFWAIVLFSVVFFLSFVYEVAKGGLDWGPLQQARRLTDMVSAERTASTTVRRVGLEGRADVPSKRARRRPPDSRRRARSHSTSPTTASGGLDHNFLTAKLEDLVNWARSRSTWPASRSGWPAAPSR